MNKKENEPVGKIKELLKLHNELIEYFGYLRKVTQDERLNEEEDRQAHKLFHNIGYKAGYLGKLITDLTREEKVDVRGTPYNMWTVALRLPVDELAWNATGFCIQVVNRAMGQLADDIDSGIRDKKTGKLISPVGTLKYEVPKAFISHGKESAALTKLEDFLHNLGILPLIVKEQASLDKTVPDKVEYYLQQSDFVIILATGDDEFDGKLHPRQNVIHEIGLAQKTHSGKIIYLLEEGTEFPSNISPKVWEHFKQRNMLNAFLCILRELRALGILLAVKPQEGAIT